MREKERAREGREGEKSEKKYTHIYVYIYTYIHTYMDAQKHIYKAWGDYSHIQSYCYSIIMITIILQMI